MPVVEFCNSSHYAKMRFLNQYVKFQGLCDECDDDADDDGDKCQMMGYYAAGQGGRGNYYLTTVAGYPYCDD